MPDKTSSSRKHLAALGVAGLAAVLLATGLMSRRSQAEQLRESAAAQNLPTVALISPSEGASEELELPARIEAWARAPIYARVSGYLKSWSVDIGSSVKAGQLLAQIETPDLDQQLQQARAELASAHSNASLASSTAKRWQSLLASDSVSRQEVDEKTGDSTAKQSTANALQANVERLRALQRYTRLVAPFDGVVTARNTDVGALINVGGTAGSELFVVSDIRRLRVYVSVPQRQVAQILPGSTAQLCVPERPGRSFPATVQSLSRAIDSGSGAMLVQLAVKNDSGELLPGGFATVRFESAISKGNLSLPPSAVIFGKSGVQVASVADGRVQLTPVTVVRDLGSSLVLSGGIARGERVIDNPPDGIASGDRVRAAADRKVTK